MRVAVPKEIKAGEKRVALVPDVISKFTKLGYEVIIESGAGIYAQATDKDYEAAAAKLASEVMTDAEKKVRLRFHFCLLLLQLKVLMLSRKLVPLHSQWN